MRTLHVNLPQGSYPIHVGQNLLAQTLPAMLTQVGGDLVVVVTNTTVDALHGEAFMQTLSGMDCRVEKIVLPDGEEYKTLATVSGIYDQLMDFHANRKTALVAFGGGVVGDMTGFAAATFMRGIPVFQVPTTLLAQVDSSVGGKTAVNHDKGKNSIGAFKQPNGVVIDLSYLQSLPQRELRAGLFELIKHGIIRDAEFFKFLEDNQGEFSQWNWDFWAEAIHRSCAIKAEVVEKDEHEADLRAILNFGHTLGHLVETHAGYGKYLHGEAVGAGMVFAAYASHRFDRIPTKVLRRIYNVLGPILTPVELPPISPQMFDELILHDKKAANHSVRFVLLKSLGEAWIREETTPGSLWEHFLAFQEDFPGVISLPTASRG